MFRLIFRSLLAGAAVGFFLFILPFLLLKAIIFMVIIVGILRLTGKARFRRRFYSDSYQHHYSGPVSGLYDSYSQPPYYRGEEGKVIHIDIQ